MSGKLLNVLAPQHGIYYHFFQANIPTHTIHRFNICFVAQLIHDVELPDPLLQLLPMLHIDWLAFCA